MSCVFDEAVAIEIPVIIHPVDCSANVWPNLLNERAVAGPLKIGARQHDEQGSSVYGTVVLPEGNLMEISHLTVPHFVENLPRLGFVGMVYVDGLGCGEKFQHTLGKGRLDPKHLQRSDNSISAKYRTEPRHTRVRVVR